VTELRSAVVVAVPEAGAAVERWLERTAGFKPSHGVPPHVTILFPFVPASDLGPPVISAVRAIAGRFPPFAIELRELRRWPDVLYLAPEPPEPFVELTEAFVVAYPEHPPYEGAHDDVVPHLTVAQGDPDPIAAAEIDVLPALPIGAWAVELLVLAQRAQYEWDTVARLPLGTPT
jgi:2'-5' RNA ligase